MEEDFEFNESPGMIELKSPDGHLDMGELNFENENSDLKEDFNLGEYSTEVNPQMNKILSNVQDGLPTIFEKSTQEDINNLKMVRNKTHTK